MLDRFTFCLTGNELFGFEWQEYDPAAGTIKMGVAMEDGSGWYVVVDVNRREQWKYVSESLPPVEDSGAV